MIIHAEFQIYFGSIFDRKQHRLIPDYEFLKIVTFLRKTAE